MAYICDKGIKCKDCEYYRYDSDNQRMACWIENDIKQPTNESLLSYLKQIAKEQEMLKKQIKQ